MRMGAGPARFTTITVGLMLVAAVTLATPPLAADAATIAQIPPTSNSVDVAGSASFTDTLAADPSFSDVTFSAPTLGFTITGGDIIGTPGTLSVADSPYVVTGTDSDPALDTGTWTYSLTVTPDVIVQASPMSDSVTVANSGAYTTTLNAASGFVGAVTFSTSTPGFAISSGDVLETTGPLSAGGSPYTITGGDTDAFGDAGTWTFSLAVTSPTGGGGGGGGGGGTTKIVQTSPTSGTVSNTMSSTFTTGPITVEGNSSPATFVTTTSNPGLTVSSSGLIASTGQLSVGTYVVSGNDSDTDGHSGTWTFTLTVTGLVSTVTFDANGGSGNMVPQSNSAPTSLSLNAFTRTRYTFVDWNTTATGSGVSYANGATFPFATAVTLYAQWKAGLVPRRTITFSPNGGKGSMRSESDNTPTAISPNRFTRAGYDFLDWSGSASGSGTHFKAGATYAFKKSVTLYAQWNKALSHSVIFHANGGTGTMATESAGKPASLTKNHFTRTGYSFAGWNSKASGLGVSYANGATFPFAATVTLFAQWKKAATAPSHNVTFLSNGGTGSMATESSDKPASLTTNQFTRTGYNFAGWNSQASGLGVSYANGATFSFAEAVTLYAQWVPANAISATVGPFAHGASTLSTTLESEVQIIANDVKAKAYEQISLLGYGDSLTATQASNSALVAANAKLGRKRAQSVAEYLEARLAAQGLTGWSISISGTGVVNSGSSDASGVIGTLS